MPSKISGYMETRFGSIQAGVDFFQFAGWLFVWGVTLPLFSYVLIPPVLFLIFLLFLIVIVVWAALFYKKGAGVFVTPIDAGMTAVFFAPLITLYFALDPSRGVRMIWQWAALIVLFYLFVGLFRSQFSFYPVVKALLFITFLFVLSGYIELIFSLIEWYTVRDWPLLFPPSIKRISGLLGNPNVLGNFLSVVWVTAVVLFIEFKQHRSRWLAGWLGAAAFIIVATQSRGAWAGLFAALLAYGLHKVWLRNRTVSFSRKQWGGIGVGIAGGTAVLLFLLALLRPSTFAADATISVRFGLWRVAFESWRQFPLFGGGANSYPSLLLQSNPVPYGDVRFFRTAHNFYLNVLAEMGLAGLTAVLLLTAQVVWLLWQKRDAWNGWTAVFFAPLVAFLTYAQVDMPLLRHMLVATLFLAALVATLTPDDPVAPSPRHRLPYFWSLVGILLLFSGWTGWKRAALYEAGVGYVQEGEWKMAADTFDDGQSLTPYTDSLFLAASGFTDGVLAFTDEAYLAAAIENQERWVGREPGWSAHHANLAALYRQAGRKAEAEAEMRQAIAHSPEVPLYYLNLGLWAEEDGEVETAVSLYRQLYQLSRTWHDSPFWQTPLAAQAIEPIPPAEMALDDGVAALVDGRFDEAIPIFAESLMANESSDAYTGLGIAYLYMGETGKAESAFERAATYAPNSAIVALWQAALPAAGEGELETAVAELQYWYGVVVGSSFSRYYVTTLFKREAVPHDFLPQLSCFTFVSRTGMQMQLLEGWYTAVGDAAKAAYVDAALLGTGDGLDFCTPVDHN